VAVGNVIALSAPPRAALYLRPGRLASAQLRDILAAHRRPCDGIVIDPTLWSRQSDLASLANSSEVETILDPRSLELASDGGRERTGIAALPWYTSTLQTPAYFADAANRHEFVSDIAAFVLERKLTAVLAPTHFTQGDDDPWLGVDDALTADLRRILDRRGGENVRLYRPLYIHSSIARRPADVKSIAVRLQGSAADAIWLGVHPFGSTHAGPLALRRYIELCLGLHLAGLPLVGVHTGTVGLLLLAMGAISGIESGVTDLESFSLAQFQDMPVRDGRPVIGSTPRVYIQSLGAFMTKKQAQAFYSVRGMTAQHICQMGCCRRGVEDTLTWTINHFVTCRRQEVNRIASAPTHMRPRLYLDEMLRPASDRAVAASRAVSSLGPIRKRLDDWRQTMAGVLDQHHGLLPTISPAVPTGRRSTRAS